MTALQYMERQLTKHRVNLKRESARGVPEEQLENIRKKIGSYEAAVEALMEQGATDTDVGHKTNADRIRAMSDEELAQFICGHSKCETCDWAGWVCGLRDWLKEPCKEEAWNEKPITVEFAE